MKSFLGFFLKQSIALNVIFIAMVIFGAFIASSLVPIEQYPNINMGKFTIRTPYPGATAENVERLVTEKVEEQIRDMEGVDYVRSTSLNGMSEIIVQMEDNVDNLALYDELRIRVLGAQNQLPIFNGEPLTPTFFINDVDEWAPVMQINLMHNEESPQLDKRPLTLLAKELRTRLEQVEGVKKVQLLGIEDQQYEVVLDPAKLERHGLTLEHVRSAMTQAGQFVPGGSIDQGHTEISIVLDDIAYDSSAIGNIVVRSDGEGNHITVAMLMNWQRSGFQKIKSGFLSNYNGQDATICKVLKKPMANAADVKDCCIVVADKFIEAHKEDNINYSINLDSTIIINDSLQVLNNSLFAACILVILSLFWFLSDASRNRILVGTTLGIASGLCIFFVNSTLIQSIVIGVFTLFIFAHSRAAVLTVNGIVFSFLGSLILFYLFGYSINEVSLLGFVLTIGIIVDDAIIVLENIRRHRELGKPIRQAAIDGTAEVFWPVISATLTTMAAFLPMLMMSGSTGQFFALVPIAVSFALFISLIECLVLLPLHVVDLSSLLGDEPLPQHDASEFTSRPGALGILHRLYDAIIKWNLQHRFLCVLGIGFAFLMAMGLMVISNPDVAKKIGINPPLRIMFFPGDSSTMWVHMRLPANNSLEQTDIEARRIAKFLLAKGDSIVDNVTCVSGLTFDASYNSVPGKNFSFIIVELASRDKRSFSNANTQIDLLREDLEALFQGTGIDLVVEPKKDGPPTGAPVSIRISGINEDSVARLADDLLTWMKSETHDGGKFDGIIDLQHNRELFQDRYRFNFDDQALANFRLNPIQAQQHVAALFDGAYVGDIRRSDDDVPIRIKVDTINNNDPTTLLQLPIINEQNRRVIRFHDIGSIQHESVPSSLVRINFERSISITGNLEQNAGAIYSPQLVQDWYRANQQHYPGANIAFSGEAESTSRSYASLWISFGIAIILIYGILASQFNSYLQPLIIMSNIMFAFIGVVFVMALFGVGANLLGPNIIRPERAWFTVQCFMAVIGLAGLVINDAIVLIDFINQRRAEGMPVDQALITAGHQRMRPILMTTITTITGLLPMAIGIPEFSIRWSPFATAFIAGISVSTAMTLVMMPTLYSVVESLKTQIKKYFIRIHPAYAIAPTDSGQHKPMQEQPEEASHPAPQSDGTHAAQRKKTTHKTRLEKFRAALQDKMIPNCSYTYGSVVRKLKEGAMFPIPNRSSVSEIASQIALLAGKPLTLMGDSNGNQFVTVKKDLTLFRSEHPTMEIMGSIQTGTTLDIMSDDLSTLIAIYNNKKMRHQLPMHEDGRILHTVIGAGGNAITFAIDPDSHEMIGVGMP